MKKRLLTALAIASMTLAMTSAAHANLIQNGGFEETPQDSGSWSTPSSITGWILSDDIEIRNNVAGAAYEGSNYAELDTTGNMAIEQVVNTIVGQLYELTFAYSPRMKELANTNGIEVFWNDTSLASLALDGYGNSGNDWKLYTYDVTGTGLDTLRFAAIGKSDSLGGSLDAISLTAAVPEPTTMLLFGTGLAGFAAIGRRKRE